ncbi:hypothetical protein [Adonisia turfae]|uniref:Mobilization protein n=1 Tax=Adonisia turfae CCMR0081 TaxID=2292702 RepID=A0A6M0RZ97_9CYAN|nr:hypothetical protein [Adonisia turfae]NEZ61032.1 hypothetical protein [Adonisia turfae CCMR0081]
MVTKEEQLQKQRDKHLEQAEQAKKKARQIDLLLAKEKRRKENRRKYIAGGYLLRALLENETPCQTYEQLLEILNITLTTDRDRVVFELPVLSPEEKKQRKKASATSAKPITAQSGRQKPKASEPSSQKRTSLPASLVAETIAPVTDASIAVSEGTVPSSPVNRKHHPGLSEAANTIVPTEGQLPESKPPLPETQADELLAEFDA